MTQESELAWTNQELRAVEQDWRKAFPVKDFGQTAWHIHGSDGTFDEPSTSGLECRARLWFDLDPAAVPVDWSPTWTYPKVVGTFDKAPAGQTHADLVARIDGEAIPETLRQQVRDRLAAYPGAVTNWHILFVSWLGKSWRHEPEV